MTAKRADGLPGFVLVTGNAGKRREIERLLGRPVAHREIDLPEIQSLDLRTVVEAKADAAWRRLRRPLVVDDTALGLAALGGFPGPLVRWLLSAVGAEGIGRIAAALGEHGASATCGLLFTDGTRRVYAHGSVAGRIVHPPRGDRGFGWDGIFQPAGLDATYGELDDAAKDAVGHRGRAWRDLVARLVGDP